MALEKLTRTSIGIHSGGQVVGSASTLNFVGAGNTFLLDGDSIDVSIAGGGGGGITAADSIRDILFIHHGGFLSDKTVGNPQKFGEIFTNVASTVDISTNATVSIDADSILLITDKEEFDMSFYSNGISGINLMRGTGNFDDNIRTTFDNNVTLGDQVDKVGYSQIPTELESDLPIDIETGVQVDVEDTAVMVL
tara:strand:- start:397 stop:978 length:582 start_codon:yes stop_codon:yes gene_type:complete